MKNYYDILGIEIESNLSEVKSAYRKLSKKFHPDLNPNDKFFEKMFKDINEANEVLSDIGSKQKYDKILGLYQNRYKNVDQTLEEIENQIKREFDELLKKKEEEIKKKFWTFDQHKKEEERIQKEQDEKKRKIYFEQLEAEQRNLIDEKTEVAKQISDFRNRIIENENRITSIQNRIGEISSILNPDQLRFNTTSKNPEDKNYHFNLDKEKNIKTLLDKIKTNIALQKRERLLRSLLNYCKSKSMSAKFASENPELTQLILNSKFNNNEISKIYKKLGSQTEKIDEFETKLFNYIN